MTGGRYNTKKLLRRRGLRHEYISVVLKRKNALVNNRAYQDMYSSVSLFNAVFIEF